MCITTVMYAVLLPIYEDLPKSPRNLNAAQKLHVVQLCAARYCQLLSFVNQSARWHYAVCFFCVFVCRHVIAVLQFYRPAKMTDMKEQQICIKFVKTAVETQNA